MSEHELLLKILDISQIYTKGLEKQIKNLEEHLTTRGDMAESRLLIRAEEIWLRQLTECDKLQTKIDREDRKLLEEINRLSSQITNVKLLMENDIAPRLRRIEKHYASEELK